jgi:hypothetical protein
VDSNLRKSLPHKQPKWTIEQVKAGLEYFRELNGRYPSANEIDNFEYLPSSRSIQRSLGGLEQVRNALGFDLSLTNLTKGSIRSDKAKTTYANAVSYEEVFYNYLIKNIPEVKVHEHKILRPGHVCCDFFIYTSNNDGFAIDIFYAQDIFTLARTINIKFKRYKDLEYKVYFVLVGNDSINQDQLNNVIKNKKLDWPKNIKLFNEKTFKENLNSLVKRE